MTELLKESHLESNSSANLESEQLSNKDFLAETALRTEKKDNLWVLVNNIKIYCSLLI